MTSALPVRLKAARISQVLAFVTDHDSEIRVRWTNDRTGRRWKCDEYGASDAMQCVHAESVALILADLGFTRPLKVSNR